MLADQSVSMTEQALAESDEATTKAAHAKAKIHEIEKQFKESEATSAWWSGENSAQFAYLELHLSGTRAQRYHLNVQAVVLTKMIDSDPSGTEWSKEQSIERL
ncbi:hypothetical protein GUJ93_ZPchr0004g39054 [Zizania palustris]|uniref:Uncharacterized protein n=1 Tax=Zizania palustris TaxID=103762 RepID=A0A8J5VND3_ZIZPA|nr:hypothetical protein GUJ93_ZPchr0004g39054 [Zizania palustris]